MTINAQPPRTTGLVGDGVTKAFSFSFPIKLPSEVDVYIKEILSTDPAIKLVNGVDYTVAFLDGGGGTITLQDGVDIPTSQYTVNIFRNTSLSQLAVYLNNTRFPSATTEAAFDKLTRITQELTADNTSMLEGLIGGNIKGGSGIVVTYSDNGDVTISLE